MKFYDFARAPNPRRARIFMAEKGIECEVIAVDMTKQEQYSDEFMKVNPLKRLPALQLDDGTVITESQAICRYFEALQPSPALFGKTPLEQAQVEMWSRRIELGLFSNIGFTFRHSSPSMQRSEVPQVPQWAEASMGKIPADLVYLNEALKGREFLAIDNFSIADINLLCSLDFMRILKLSIPEELTDLRRVHANLAARPSAKA